MSVTLPENLAYRCIRRRVGLEERKRLGRSTVQSQSLHPCDGFGDRWTMKRHQSATCICQAGEPSCRRFIIPA